MVNRKADKAYSIDITAQWGKQTMKYKKMYKIEEPSETVYKRIRDDVDEFMRVATGQLSPLESELNITMETRQRNLTYTDTEMRRRHGDVVKSMRRLNNLMKGKDIEHLDEDDEIDKI